VRDSGGKEEGESIKETDTHDYLNLLDYKLIAGMLASPSGPRGRKKK